MLELPRSNCRPKPEGRCTISHVSELSTDLRSLECARRAAIALGIPIAEGITSLRGYYGATTPIDLAFGEAGRSYHLGLARGKDGTYTLVGDLWGVVDCAGGRDWCEKMGPGFSQYKMADQAVQAGHNQGRVMSGHVFANAPTRFLQEYALQVGQAGARACGFQYVRAPQQNGDIVLRLTGPKLPPGAYILLTAKADGKTTVAAYGVKGPSCLIASKFLRDALGKVTNQQLTSEYDVYHNHDGSHVRVKA